MLATLAYFSEPLQKCMLMHVIMPQRPGRHPLIVQLHGLEDDHTIWQRRTTIEAEAERIGAAVALLDGGRSFYTDAADGTGDWEKHILFSTELVERTFAVGGSRKRRAIGGQSMGGYGAVKIGLKYADRFGSVVSNSGALDIVRWYDDCMRPTEMRHIFGARPKASEDPFRLLAGAKPLPRLWIDCGSEDFLIEHNRRFQRLLMRRGVRHEYREYPGSHEWGYWQARLPESFDHHAAVFAASAKR
jgi:putative tributyrin esterase